MTQSEAQTQITQVDGGWRCQCGLVWPTDYSAIGCTNRGHQEEYATYSAPGAAVGADFISQKRIFQAIRRDA